MSANPYDIKLTAGSTSYGFMLVKPPDAPKQLEIDEVPGPGGARVRTEEAASHLDFDPNFDVPFAQGDFSGGIGQLIYDQGDPTRVWWTSGVCVHQRGKAYLAPDVDTASIDGTGTTTDGMGGFVTYYEPGGTRYYFAWKQDRLFRATSGTGWTLVWETGADITGVEFFDGAMYIGLAASVGSTIDYYYQGDPTAGATWTPTSVNDTTVFDPTLGKPNLFARVGGTMYAARNKSGVDNVSKDIFFTTDPTASGWVGPIVVGDESYPVKHLLAVNNYLFVVKDDAIYSIGADQEASEVIWHWRHTPSPKNFEFVSGFSGYLVYTGRNDVHLYDPVSGASETLGIAQQDGFSINEILGCAADNQYIYVLASVRVPTIRSASSAALFRCWRDERGIWCFECIWEDTASTSYYQLGALPAGNGTRLFWGNVSGSNTISYMNVPAGWDETNTGNYADSGTLYTSISRVEFPGFVKWWSWLGTTVEADTNNTIACAYSLNDGATWTTLATRNTDGLVLTDAGSIESRSIALRFVFSSQNGSVTPVLDVFDVHARIRYRYLQLVSATVRVASGLALRSGGTDTRSQQTIKEQLETLRTLDDGRVTYEDFLGNSFPVNVTRMPYRPSRDETAKEYEMEATLFMARIGSGE